MLKQGILFILILTSSLVAYSQAVEDQLLELRARLEALEQTQDSRFRVVDDRFVPESLEAGPGGQEADPMAKKAALLGTHAAGHGSGEIPISDGQLNTQLNADLLDGKHAGNGNNQIPLSNGSVNTNLNADLLDGNHASVLAPPGTIVAYGGATAPTGWLLCNGAEYGRSQYADLWNVIQGRFGSGNGSTTFNVPDLRGRFLRGVDQGAGLDEDPGRTLGSPQGDAIQRHAHKIWISNTGGGAGCRTVGPGHTDTPDIGGFYHANVMDTGIESGTACNGQPLPTANFATETRPKNLAVNFIIKY
jgi:microcystin-dependent protein